MGAYRDHIHNRYYSTFIYNMECPVCLEFYDVDLHIAIKLVCCHTLCTTCCNNQIRMSDQISCPQCFKITDKSAISNECETIKRIASSKSGGPNTQLSPMPPETSSSDLMKILVRNFRNRFVELTVQKQCSVFQLKELIEIVEGVQANSQWILFNGLSLENTRRLSEYNIVNGSILTLVMRSFGGTENKKGLDAF